MFGDLSGSVDQKTAQTKLLQFFIDSDKDHEELERCDSFLDDRHGSIEVEFVNIFLIVIIVIIFSSHSGTRQRLPFNRTATDLTNFE